MDYERMLELDELRKEYGISNDDYNKIIEYALNYQIEKHVSDEELSTFIENIILNFDAEITSFSGHKVKGKSIEEIIKKVGKK